VAREHGSSVLDEAWGTFPQTRETAEGFASFTSARVERFLSLIVALGCLIMGGQAFLNALTSTDEAPGWHLPLMLVVFIPLAAMIVSGIIGRGVAVCAGTFAVIYPLCLLVWPAATGPVTSTDDYPWIWYLVNVATVCAALAFPLPLQIIWAALVPIQFGIIRLITADLAPQFWIPTILDVSFALILGGVLVVIGWVFRSVALNVDQTRMRAVASYAAAAAADAAEKERIAVAALMHDSVLAALIAAERAESPRERALAATMAREALTRLANAEQDAGEGSDVPVPAARIADELDRAIVDLGLDIAVARTIAPEADDIPGRVARALVLASTQAIANSVQHTDAEGLSVALIAGDGVAAGGVSITVRDHGAGFEVGEVPDDRLGIRASIFARVAAVGGTTRIASGDDGTTVVLAWQGAA
jgi:signal transduction histidine kinase